ncbi:MULTISPECIES: hypothetical protein [Bradyrhizobium]|uniref:Uncharacterized protein n=1 Tax=Bradyrhizobium zhengyangense TaxID=2911009 RepID=A0A9X1RJ45_9BRAD|nr:MULTISPECIES: hypothetical protein [Bradyrhizobium]MCG2632630.1 hypothetical protein [Bradyrhizobium zhengyangense]MCG2645391.1 hypothetical protein [Bradyrhizobium zhengyangense]MCG2672863.1 hypothetical protein [Bradyrhizobium zhengyangense]MDN4985685.1 hypothetical protein [Bradyrhizobium sp. WYCCWR 13022]MDT4740886.1 hypothetical protein [Bradyrhizobium sp. WYCCWR 12699]
MAAIKEALQGSEGTFVVGLVLEGEMRLFDKIEKLSVPVVHLDNVRQRPAKPQPKPCTLAFSPVPR